MDEYLFLEASADDWVSSSANAPSSTTTVAELDDVSLSSTDNDYDLLNEYSSSSILESDPEAEPEPGCTPEPEPEPDDTPESEPDPDDMPEPDLPSEMDGFTLKPFPTYIRPRHPKAADSDPDEYESDEGDYPVPRLCTEGACDELFSAVYDNYKVAFVPKVTWTTRGSKSHNPLHVGQAMYNLTGDFDSIQRVKDDMFIGQATCNDSSGMLVEASLDPYIDEDAEMKYLLSRPTCYIILGKPSVHAFKLGQWMAEEYGCVHVDVETELFAEVHKPPPREDHCILMQTVLRNGGTVPIISVLEVLFAALCTERVWHRGYVLTGFPIYPQAQCEPLDQFAYIRSLDLHPDVYILITCPDKDFLHMHASLKYDGRLGKVIDMFSGYSRKEVEKPEVAEPGEEETDWDAIEADANNNELLPLEVMAEEVKEEEGKKQAEVVGAEEDVEEEEESIVYPEEPGFDHGMCLTNVLTRECAQKLLREYKYEVLPLIELILLDYDPSKVFKLDARTSFEDMREDAKVWFASVPIQAVVAVEMVDYVPPPLPEDSILSLVKYEMDMDIISNESLVAAERTEGDSPAHSSDSPLPRQSYDSYHPAHQSQTNLPFSSSLFSLPEIVEDVPRTMFNRFSKYNAIDPGYNWTWSKWETVCPVGLLEGRYLEGIPELACRFMGRIFYMSSEEAVEKFKENPRRYLMPPQPKLPRRICIVGPDFCGENSLAARLGQDLGLPVVHFDQVTASALATKRADMVQLVRYEALGDAVVQINQESVDSYLASTSSSSNEMGKVRGWDMRIVDYLQDYLYTRDHYLQERIHRAFPLLYIPEIEEGETDEPCHAEYRKHFPDLIRIPMPPPPYNRISIDSIIRYCDFQVDRYLQIDTDLTPEETGHEIGLVLTAIQDEFGEESNDGGWILDGVPLIESVWKSMENEGTYPTQVIYLENEDYTYEQYSHGLCQFEPTIVPKYLESSMPSLEKYERLPCSSVRQLSRQMETLDLLNIYDSDMTIKSNLSWIQGRADSEESIPPVFSDTFMGGYGPFKLHKEKMIKDSYLDPILQDYCDYAEGVKDYPDSWKDFKKILKGKVLITEMDVTDKTTEERAEVVMAARNVMFLETPRHLTLNELEERFDILDSDQSGSFSSSDSSSDSYYVDSYEGSLNSEGSNEGSNEAHNEDEDEDDDEDESDSDHEVRNVDEFAEVGSLGSEEEEDDSWSVDSQDSSFESEESIDSDDVWSDSDSDSNSDSEGFCQEAPLGDTGVYCPVLFVKDNVLAPGKKKFICEYKNKIYYLYNHETFKAFTAHPERYCNFPGPMYNPALRICIVGSVASGKTTVATHLAREMGLHHIDFTKEFIAANWRVGAPQIGREYEDTYEPHVVKEPPNIYDTESSRSFFLDDIEEEDENEPTEEQEELEAELKRQNSLREYIRYNVGIAPALVQPHVGYLWKTWPFCGDGLILDGFPRTQGDMDYMERNALWPHVFVELRISPSTTVTRMIEHYLSEWDKRNAVRVAIKEEDDTIRFAEYEENTPKMLMEVLQEYFDAETTYWDEIYDIREEYNVGWWMKHITIMEDFLSELSAMSDSELIAEDPELIAEDPELIVEDPELITEDPELIAKDPELIAEDPELITEDPELIAKVPELIAEGPELIAEDPELIAEDPELITEDSELITEDPELIAEEPELIPKPYKRFVKILMNESMMLMIQDHHEWDEVEDEILQREYSMGKAMEEAVDMVDEEYGEFKSRFNVEWRVEADHRLDEELRNWNDLDSATLDIIRYDANSRGIPWLVVDADKDEEDVIASVKLIQDHCFWKLPPRPMPLFLPQGCYEIPVEDAEDFLRAGYFFISQFGRWCPVQLHGSPARRLMFLPDKGMSPTCIAVIHRKYIYFLANTDSLSCFEQDPNLYINMEICTRTTPISISIVGLPKVGKSLVAQALAEDLHMRVISRCSAVRYVLEELPWTELAASMRQDLSQGKLLPAHKAMQAVQACMMDARGTVKGYIFDGFPDKCGEYYALSMCGILPTLVLVLESTREKIERMYEVTQEKGLLNVPRRAYSIPHIRARMYNWFQRVPNYLLWFNIMYQNVFVVDCSYSFWRAKLQCMEHIDKAALALSCYDSSVIRGLAVPLQYCCISPRLFIQYQSYFMHFCPACLLMRVRTTGGFPCQASGMVQYKGFIYWLCERHYELFLRGPDRYVRPRNAEQFHDPEAIPILDYPEHQVFDNGLCPVTHLVAKGKWVRVPGFSYLAVKYRRHIYLFADLASQIEFMKTPEEYYCRAIYLPRPKLDPEKKFYGFGFLEHSMSRAVIDAVSSLEYRPSMPGLSIEQSAAVIMGMVIQSKNYANPLMMDVGEYTLFTAYEHMHTRDKVRLEYLKIKPLRYVLWSHTLVEEGFPAYHLKKPDSRISVEESHRSSEIEESESRTSVEEGDRSSVIEEQGSRTSVEEGHRSSVIEVLGSRTLVEEGHRSSLIEVLGSRTLVDEGHRSSVIEVLGSRTSAEEGHRSSVIEVLGSRTSAEEGHRGSVVEDLEALTSAEEDHVSSVIEEPEARILVERGVRAYHPPIQDKPNSMNYVRPKVTDIILGPKRDDVSRAIELMYESHRQSVLDAVRWSHSSDDDDGYEDEIRK